MARLKALPELNVIHGFKGVIDFYLWKGLPCARRWPRFSPAHLTPATRAAAATFGAIVKAYSHLGAIFLAAFQEDARDQPRTPRDLFISGVLGTLHEASMTDFLTLLTECRDSLAALTNLLNALQSINTDALQIRGQDQLFTIQGVLAKTKSAAISGANGFLYSDPVPENQYWAVTTVTASDDTSPCTEIIASNYHDANGVIIGAEVKAFAKWENYVWSGFTLLDHEDTIRIQYSGSLAGDWGTVSISGYVITVET